jgi:hypothetical protein
VWEGTSVYYGSVMFEGNVFTMIYPNNGSTLSFGMATSTHGIHWVKDARNPVYSKSNTANAWAPLNIGYPSLVRVGSEIRFYYTGFMSNGSEAIGYAVKR